jgi:NSS family neurotransmitter:Na+ symporter
VEEVSAESENDWPFPKWWLPVISYVVPILGITIFSWWMWLSATVYAPNDWYDPTSLYSVATCVVQWAMVIVTLFILNRWMNQRLDNPLNN